MKEIKRIKNILGNVLISHWIMFCAQMRQIDPFYPFILALHKPKFRGERQQTLYVFSNFYPFIVPTREIFVVLCI